MRAGHAPGPLDRHIDLFTVLVHIDGDALHQHTHDLLAVLRSFPVRATVLGHREPSAGWPRSRDVNSGDARVGSAYTLFLQVLLVTERLFPAPLQLTGDEAVFRLDGFVLTSRPLGLVVRALQPLVPMGL